MARNCKAVNAKKSCHRFFHLNNISRAFSALITRYRSHVIFQSMRRHFSPVKSLAASGHFIVHRLKMFVKMKVLSPIECFHSRGQHLYKFIGTKESVSIRKEFNSQRIIQSLIFPVIQNGICVFRYAFLFVEKSEKNIV